MMKTERLTFREFRDSDLQAVFEMLNNPEVAQPAGFKALLNEDEARLFLEGLIENSAYAVTVNEDLIGYCRVYKEEMDSNPYKNKDCVGVGFAIRKDRQHQGYGTEMLTFIVTELKKKHDYVFADAFLDNEASNALIRKCGFKYIEDYSMYFEFLGKEMTCHSYVI